jgi:hypothetical protein
MKVQSASPVAAQDAADNPEEMSSCFSLLVFWASRGLCGRDAEKPHLPSALTPVDGPAESRGTLFSGDNADNRATA